MEFDDERNDNNIIGLIFLAFGIAMIIFAIGSYYQQAFASENGYIPYDAITNKFFDGHPFAMYTYTVSNYYGPGGDYALSANSVVVNGTTVDLTKTTSKNFFGTETVYVFTANHTVTKFAIDGETFTPGIYHDGFDAFIYGLFAGVGLFGFALSLVSSRKNV